jgi:hypothetical protein
MAWKVDKSDVWAVEVRDEAGGLAEKLQPLAEAGADLQFLIARRQPDRPGTGVAFLGGLRGTRQLKAAQAAGFAKAGDVAALRVEAPNKPGLALQILQRVAQAGISLRGVSAAVLGARCVVLLAFDSAADRDRAAKALRK